MSRSKKYWNALYERQVASERNFLGYARDAETGFPIHRSGAHRHHINRRLGQNILIYCYIEPEFHEWIEAHSRESRALGWLRNEGQGYPKDPNQPRPWVPGTVINEHLLDQEYENTTN